jgi:hypothetical protein
MKRINWKTWTGTATFWRTLSKRSLIVFLAGVFCLFGSLGFILDSSNPQATTAGELTMNILVRTCLAVGWAFFGTHRMFKSMIPVAGVQVSVIWLLHPIMRPKRRRWHVVPIPEPRRNSEVLPTIGRGSRGCYC